MSYPGPPQPGTLPTAFDPSAHPAPPAALHQAGPAVPAPVPAGPGAFSTALRSVRTMLAAIWHGDPVAALRIAAGQVTRHQLLWWLVLLANGVTAGLLVASFVAKSAQGAASVTNSVLDPFTGGYTSSYVDDAFSVPFSTLLGVVVTIAFLVVGVLVLRTVTVFWTFGVRGARGRFRDAAAVVATASSITPLLLAVAWVLSLIPGAGGALLSIPVLAIGGTGVAIMSEALVYIGLNRTVRFAKSPLIPHAALTIAHVALCMVLFAVVNVVVLASLLG